MDENSFGKYFTLIKGKSNIREELEDLIKLNEILNDEDEEPNLSKLILDKYYLLKEKEIQFDYITLNNEKNFINDLILILKDFENFISNNCCTNFDQIKNLPLSLLKIYIFEIFQKIRFGFITESKTQNNLEIFLKNNYESFGIFNLY